MLGNVMRGLKTPRLVETSSVYRELLEKNLIEEGTALPTRIPVKGDPSTYFRASSLGYMCTRADFLQIRERVAMPGGHSGETKYTFAIGHAYHGMFQDGIMPTVAPDRMLGWWKTNDSVMRGYAEGRPMLITRELAKASMGDEPQYVEVYGIDHEHMIGGHPDLVMDWTDSGIDGVPDAKEVQEFKTRDEGRWSYIDPNDGGAPEPGHVLQVQTYMWLLGLDHARIVYIKKGERRLGEAFVEWVIPRSEEAITDIKQMLTGYWDAMYAAWDGAKEPPARLERCTEFSKGRPKWCPMRYECFGKKARKDRGLRVLTEAEVATLTNSPMPIEDDAAAAAAVVG